MTSPLPVPLPQAYKLLNHGPVTLVTTAHGGQSNVMAAAWVMPLDFDPPLVCLVLDSQTYSRGLLDASGEFALNLPVRAQAAKVLAAGSCSARELAGRGKLERCGFATFPATQVQAPLIQGCAAWLECRVQPQPENERRHDLFIARVEAAWADPDIFSDGRWHFPDEACRTLHYVAGGQFFVTGEAFEATPLPPAEP
ncbi:flavin reductase family protein [Azospira inquinata]|uniref:Flavin reductase family protein n=1 Tax=Azospira inquinata TaxID=2785627 RepID=A0A975XUM3_9RHOO|nr:flavin reductase family protein [Azospira inquinata]QWT45743.1 flavin reductase family protein [Azospira inquinata]QWT48934.1 flavin reductase family protein [Azospira inquinata]